MRQFLVALVSIMVVAVVVWAADPLYTELTEGSTIEAEHINAKLEAASIDTKAELETIVGFSVQTEPTEGAFEDGDKTRLDALFDQETSSGGTTPSITVTNGSVFTHTVATGETTFTFASPEASGSVSKFTLVLTNGGSQTVNWPASVDWPSGVVPTLTTSGVDILTFLTVDGGTTWYGFYPGIDIK